MAGIILGLDTHMGIALLRACLASSCDEDAALVHDLAVLHIVEGKHCLGTQRGKVCGGL